MTHSTWIPDRPVSKGAAAYHDAVINTSWHQDNVGELIAILQKHIKAGDVVADFGAGTGGSALLLLKKNKKDFRLWLVDNSASWLAKAYETLHSDPRVSFFLSGKDGERFLTLAEVIGKQTVDHVFSANTVHLIPPIGENFRGIYDALKAGGTFAFQSGNIARTGRPTGMLMIDDSVNAVHDIALELIRTDERFAAYRAGLEDRIAAQAAQRKFVFPLPRPVEFYTDELKKVGFTNIAVTTKAIPVKYRDWLNFLRVRRLQAGILPEVGGKDATPQEEQDRDQLISLAAKQLFAQLKKENPHANAQSFTAEWTYFYAEK